jgi:hypothetical protein
MVGYDGGKARCVCFSVVYRKVTSVSVCLVTCVIVYVGVLNIFQRHSTALEA